MTFSSSKLHYYRALVPDLRERKLYVFLNWTFKSLKSSYSLKATFPCRGLGILRWALLARGAMRLDVFALSKQYDIFAV